MRIQFGTLMFAAAMLGGGVSRGQSAPAPSPAPCSVVPQPDPCATKPADKPDATKKFPFPGESADKEAAQGAPAPNAPTPSLSGVPAAPDSPGEPPSQPAEKKFPFPGPADSSSSSSSSSSDDADPADPDAGDAGSGAAGLKDKGSEGAQTKSGRHLLHRVNPVGTKLQTADEREAEDLDIAHFYVQQGDLQGAYLRSKDAVTTAPDDPDAHFALAEVAVKLNKKDEAIAEYNECLKHDPTDKQGKSARKALARLNP